MAGIKQTLSLEDKMSNTLNSTQKAALQNIQTFNSLSKEIEGLENSLTSAENINPDIVGTESYSSAVEAIETLKAEQYSLMENTTNLMKSSEDFQETLTNTNAPIGSVKQSLTDMSSAATDVISPLHDIVKSLNGSDYTSDAIDNLSSAYVNFSLAGGEVVDVLNSQNPTLEEVNNATEELYNAYKELLEAMDAVAEEDPELIDAQAYEDVRQSLDNLGNSMNSVDDDIDNQTISFMELNQQLEVAQKAWGMLSNLMGYAEQAMEKTTVQLNSEIGAAAKMKSFMGVSNESIQSFYDYAAALQQSSIVGDEAIISAGGILSMAASSEESLENLTTAAVYAAEGLTQFNTSQSDVESTAKSLERAIDSSASMLVRQNILTQDQADYIDSLNSKQEKEAELARIVGENFSYVNDALTNTAAGAIVQADNALGDLGEEMGKSVMPYFAAFKQLLVDILTPAVQAFKDNASWLVPVLILVAAAIGIIIVALTIYNIYQSITTAKNWAMVAPLLIMVAVIALIVGVIFLAVNAFNQWSGGTVSAVGVIMGILYTLWAFFKNTIVTPIWNLIVDLVNFLANCFKDPVTSIKILFLDMAKSVLQNIQNLMKGIEDLINKIPGVQIDITSGLSNLLGNIENTASTLKEDMGWEEVMQHMEQTDYGEAYNAGYDKGTQLQNNISTWSENIDDVLGGTVDDILGGISNDFSNTLGGLTGTDSTGSKAVQTTTNDEVEISEDDMQLLLDVATRDYKLNYQQVTPEITLTFGDIRETADVDDVLDQVADRLQEIYDGNLEVS